MTEHRTIYTFSGFRIDTVNKVLWRDKTIVPLTPKVFDTLILLVQNAPNLVEKTALMEALWPDQFVEESNITFNIKMLRKALGDDAGNPVFIETVPRRGYRFIAAFDQDQAEVSKTRSAVPLIKYRYSLIAISFLILAGIVGIASWTMRPKSAATTPKVFSAGFKTTKLTDTGKVNHAVISPDGKYFAYSNEGGGRHSLWIRQISNGSNTEILPPAEFPFFGLAFSADSEYVFYTRRDSADNFQPNIYRVPIFGGTPTKIVSESQGQISVTSDEHVVFIRYEKGSHNHNSLMIVDGSGHHERVIKTSTAPDVFWAAAISPDQRKVIAAYGHTNNAARNVSLTEIDVATGEQRELTDDRFFQISSLAWLPDQSGFMFTAYKTLGEPARIWTFSYNTKRIENISKDSTEYVKVSVTKATDRVVATTLTADFGIFVGRDPSTSRYLTQARDGFSFAADGRIVYASDASESEDIWIMSEAGTDQKQLTTDPSLDAYPLVSGDGHIYFASNRSGENQIWRMNMDGSDQTRITRSLGGKPRFVTPDGKWLYYSSAIDQSVWKAATDGGGEEKIHPGGFYQAFSPDGSQMAYLRRNKETNKFEIVIVALETQATTKQRAIADGDGLPYYLNWTADGKALTYTLKDQNGDYLLRMHNLSNDESRVVFNLGKEDIMDCRISPGNQSYVFIRGTWNHDAVLLSGLNPAAASSNDRRIRDMN